ncbi:mRNA cap guanine-N7 methyltransferase [Termitomyces sp. J132]|nr:mRNA cap guanine-N7 methyltransferase [Termitomyces sp. J132]
MPAFDPVRDAVLNSPIGVAAPMLPLPSPSSSVSSPLASPSLGGRRATAILDLLNPAETHEPPHHSPAPLRSSTLPSPTRERDSPVSRSRPSSSSSSISASFSAQATIAARTQSSMPPPPPPASSSIPYAPRARITPPTSVMIPLSPAEMETYRDYRFRGRGAIQITQAKKRRRNDGFYPDPDQPPQKKMAGDVGVVVDHYNSRPDVGVVQRLESPIIGLKNFNNWVKSVLITRFAHPALAAVLDMGCGKGGDMTKWAKARVCELVGVDIAAVSIDQARSRWETLRPPKFAATFAALDCYTQPLTNAFPPDLLGMDPSYGLDSDVSLTGEPFDVVSMQFCMHYAFETEQKARCMLDNVSRFLRRGGSFIGTIPNAEFLLEHLDVLPPGAKDLSFGNSVYKIKFESRDKRKVFGHKYWFFLQDAVDNVPEYVVYWDSFVEMAAEYNLYPVYKEEFHHVFSENQDHQEFGPLMVRMKVVDVNGESSMDEDQWEAANIYIAFAFEKR